MKYILLLCCLLMTSMVMEAQKTYYVAIIKGEVTYNGKQLKKRAKITTTGELRFGSPEAYIKVSGPGGIFTFRANEKDTRGEFVTALSQELFPLAKARNSFAMSMSMDNNIHYLYSRYSLPFWEQTYTLPDSLRSRTADIYLVADGADGLLVRTAAKKNGQVKLTQEPFAGESPPEVSIIMVNNRQEWETKLSKVDSVVHLNAELEHWPITAGATRPGILLMNTYYPNGMVDRKPFQRELRRQVKYIQPSSTAELLDDYDVQALFEEMFGISRFPSDAWEYVSSLLKE